MRILSLLLLLGVASAQGKPRTVAEILSDHARALGEARSVKTLRATIEAGGGRRLTTQWRLPGLCLREIATGRGQFPWREFFGPEGAYVSKGFFERFRPNQLTTRGSYYLLKALAEPFPLLAYVGNEAAQAGLEVGAARDRGKTYEVLYTARDEYGVRAIYLLDPVTHLLANVRFESEENKPFASVTLGDYRKVDGVMLPHATYGRWVNLSESPTRKKLVARSGVRDERIVKWELNPDLGKTRFAPPGLGKGGGKGFSKRLFRTGPDPYDLAVGDLDLDGELDIAVACEGGVYVHFGGGKSAPLRVPLGRGHHRGLQIEDFDFDGRPELITASNVEPHQTFFLVSFDRQRKPKIKRIYGAPLFPHTVLARDLDLDGIADLLATGVVSQDVQLKFGTGTGDVRLVGTGWPLAREGTTERGYGAAVGDIDADGVKDIAVADGTRVVIFRGQLNLAFQPRIFIPEKVDPKRPLRPVDVEFTDLDGDGLDDLLIAQEHPLEDLRDDLLVALNTGSAFKITAAVDAGARVQAVASGHFNADPYPDAAAVSFLTGELSILAGDGRGGLGPAERFASGRGACRLLVTDFDGDGRDDILVANRLDDSISLFLNRREAPRAKRAPPARAVVCPPRVRKRFDLVGLSQPFAFRGEFRLPRAIQDPSGLACLGSIPGQPAQFVLVSDKRSAIFRLTLDRAGGRLLVGPAIPLRGLEEERLDLEGVAYDPWSGNLFLGSEADGSILRVSIFGNVLGRVPTAIPSTGNDGIEGVALRRKKDGTPLLYVFKERFGTTGRRPGAYVYKLEEDPFALELRQEGLVLPVAVADQSGATVFGDRLFVVSRLARGIVELGFHGERFAKEFKVASFLRLTDGLLGLRSPRTPMFGNVEAITFDWDANLYLIVDNNREVIGLDGLNRGPEGRFLWFENRGTFEKRPRPRRVRVLRILIPWPGADGAAAAGEKARRLLAEARAGEEFGRLADAYTGQPPGALVIVTNAVAKTAPGDVRIADLPPALGRLAFNLAVGEIGLCEYHKEESREGWSIVLRVE